MNVMTNKASQIAQTATAALLLATLSAPASFASAPQGDVFARTTKKAIVKADPIATPTQWFEAIDTAVTKLRPTPSDDAVLSRPFNQDPKRVEEWATVATKVAKNYRQLSRTIRTLAIPGGMSDAKEYQSLTADWYDDAASIFEDMTRPRPPAKTMDELEAQLTDIKQRASELGRSNADLHALDTSLRKTYKVHRARYDDALTQYVSRK